MKKLWLIEIWEEEREVFKSLVGHLGLFLVIIMIFLLSNYIISLSNLHNDQKELIEKFHFWTIAITLTLAIVSSIFKMIILIIKRIKNDIYRIH
jgi:hypothetical protein